MTFYFRSSDRNAVNKHVKLEKKQSVTLFLLIFKNLEVERCLTVFLSNIRFENLSFWKM